MKVFWSNDIQAAIRRTIPDKATVLKIKNQLIDQIRAPNCVKGQVQVQKPAQATTMQLEAQKYMWCFF